MPIRTICPDRLLQAGRRPFQLKVQPAQDAIFPFEHPALWQRPVVAMDALTHYMSKLFYPFQLTTDYGRTPAKALDLALKYPLWLTPVAVTVWAAPGLKSEVVKLTLR